MKEREAIQAQSAEAVVVKPRSALQRKCACGQHTIGGGECDSCQKAKTSGDLQRTATNRETAPKASASVDEALRSPGHPLDASTRALMESRFDRDFSNVRVHTGSEAAKSAESIDASAYTVRQDIVFGARQYSPQTFSGQKLLAHELTHTVQQRAGVHLKSAISEPSDSSERHADEVARTVMEGQLAAPLLDAYQPAPVESHAGAPLIQRQAAGHETGVPHRAERDALSVAGPGSKEIEYRIKHAAKKGAPVKKPSAGEMPGLFARFVKGLISLEKTLQGNATQSWGMIIYGEGDGKDGPATRASKDAKIIGSFDYAAFMEVMNLILSVMPDNLDYRKKLEELRESLDARKLDKVAEFTKEVVEAIEEIKDEEDGGATGKPTGKRAQKQPLDQGPKITLNLPGMNKSPATTATTPTTTTPVKSAAKTSTPTTPPPGRVQLGQWAATDLSGNQYIMIKYSDGSKRFVFGSIFGVKDISDPGPMEWKQVQGAGSTGTSQAGVKKSSTPKAKEKTTEKAAGKTAGQEQAASPAHTTDQTHTTGQAQTERQTSTPTAASAATLNSSLDAFIADLKKDSTYGSKVRVTSTVRDPVSDARAVLNNQKSDSEYYKIFSANWEAAILSAVKDRDLKLAADFESAVSDLAAWITAKPERSPHVAGRAVDFALAGGSSGFKQFIKTEAEKRGYKFIDETAKHHYHVQM